MLNKKVLLSLASAGIALMAFTGASYAASSTTTSNTVHTQKDGAGAKPPGQDGKDPFANLDDATKEQVKSIMDQVQAGTLSREDADTQLKALGIEAPQGQEAGQDGKDPFANLDDATKEQVKSIMDQVQAGTLSHEDADTQLKALGIEAPQGQPGAGQLPPGSGSSK